jgi:hypothetical protein
MAYFMNACWQVIGCRLNVFKIARAVSSKSMTANLRVHKSISQLHLALHDLQSSKAFRYGSFFDFDEKMIDAMRIPILSFALY